MANGDLVDWIFFVGADGDSPFGLFFFSLQIEPNVVMDKIDLGTSLL